MKFTYKCETCTDRKCFLVVETCDENCTDTYLPDSCPYDNMVAAEWKI